MVFPFTQISNDYCQKSYNGFWGFLINPTTSQIFLIYTFVTMKQRQQNITTSLLMVHLKCTVVHYANLNSSSKNKAFLNYGSLNMLFRFFRFLIYVYFNETFVKKLMKQLSSFNTNFQNSFEDVVYCRILRYQTLWY